MDFINTMPEPTLAEKLRANKARSIAQADATANKEKQQKYNKIYNYKNSNKKIIQPIRNIKRRYRI